MSQARTKLLSRLSTISECLNNQCVVDGLPTDTTKNAAAAMFRSGIAVLQFATIEAFLKERTGEALKSLSPTAIRFSDLSDKLQQAVTLSALQGILFQAKLQSKSSQVNWILQALPEVANAGTNISALSPYSFGHSSSNLSNEIIPTIFGAFGIDGGWNSINELAKLVGAGGTLDYSQAFKDLADRRHSAAHDVSINIPLNDLNSSTTTTLGICCAFDLLISHSVSLHNQNKVPNKASGLINHSHLKLRYISPHQTKTGSFSEQTRTANGLHTKKVHTNLATAKSSALANPQEHLIVLNSKGLPEEWSSW
jgi:hypothetical protein